MPIFTEEEADAALQTHVDEVEKHKQKQKEKEQMQKTSAVLAEDTATTAAALHTANKNQAEKCNRIAERHLIQGEVYNAEKMLQKGIRMCRTDRGIELLTELVEGRAREKVAGREYKGRPSAVDGAIRAMFGDSSAFNLDKQAMDLIIEVCQSNEERGAELYAKLEGTATTQPLTSEQAVAVVHEMHAMWDFSEKQTRTTTTTQAGAHGHSHNGVACGGHGHAQGSHSGARGLSSESPGMAGGVVGMASIGGMVGLMAHQFGERMPLASILAPLGSMSCVLITLGMCYYLWRTGDNIRDARVIFPAISELGAAMPEQRVYQVGFAITGLLLALHIRLFSQIVLPKLLEHATTEMQTNADLAISWGYYSAAGVVLQGVFTLEMKVSMQSMVHWGGAVLFMSGAMNHAQASKSLYQSAIETSSDHLDFLRNEHLLMAVNFRKLILDYSSFVMFVPIILAQIFFASGGSPTAAETTAIAAAAAAAARRGEPPQPANPDPKTMNTMGVMQWAIILQFAVYFCTYAVDLYVCGHDNLLKDKMD